MCSFYHDQIRYDSVLIYMGTPGLSSQCKYDAPNLAGIKYKIRPRSIGNVWRLDSGKLGDEQG